MCAAERYRCDGLRIVVGGGNSRSVVEGIPAAGQREGMKVQAHGPTDRCDWAPIGNACLQCARRLMPESAFVFASHAAARRQFGGNPGKYCWSNQRSVDYDQQKNRQQALHGLIVLA